ncbi:hypothetical protein F4803DRAFT_515116 [Xylaria telfairii]|nr:hypothetical protein F4803DRAFT_515116 [Xylaria telfairii]
MSVSTGSDSREGGIVYAAYVCFDVPVLAVRLCSCRPDCCLGGCIVFLSVCLSVCMVSPLMSLSLSLFFSV